MFLVHFRLLGSRSKRKKRLGLRLLQVKVVSTYVCYNEEIDNLMVTGTFYGVGPLLVRP